MGFRFEVCELRFGLCTCLVALAAPCLDAGHCYESLEHNLYPDTGQSQGLCFMSTRPAATVICSFTGRIVRRLCARIFVLLERLLFLNVFAVKIEIFRHVW